MMESIQKTKNLFHKSVDNLKSFISLGYQKLCKQTLPDPFPCSGRSRKKDRKDRSLPDFSYNWEVGLEVSKTRNNDAIVATSVTEEMRDEDECGGSLMNFSDTSPEKKVKESGGKEEKKRVRSSKVSKGEEQYYYKRNGDGSYALAQKMKELEMMDVGDMEHVLDVEEALHYYSRLRSPVYLSIVDRFFMDMYSELYLPPASASINRSKRRFGSIRL
ncbi:RAD3-like DNA-binding helicase protein isoform 1 [Hibiscus syriacus]|uniref:RAD3-like DNA-binding helicase protein isoform 1 n=1 Tax=Hibiscus syriacus TaxID=106335 RepID=A0A6A3ACR3_HIBSY|nr:RAD3-like DNA-binding helicase protein isoform 1 [Hibiscus syriacus]